MPRASSSNPTASSKYAQAGVMAPEFIYLDQLESGVLK